jgi:hypothetical protein
MPVTTEHAAREAAIAEKLVAYSNKAGEAAKADNNWLDWLPYAAAAVAALAPAAADATIIYSGLQNVTIGSNGTFKVSLSGNYFAKLSNIAGAGSISSFRRALAGPRVAAYGNYGRRFPSGAVIGGSGAFNNGVFLRTASFYLGRNVSYGAFKYPNSRGFLGVQLANNDYGWIDVQVVSNGASNSSGYTTTIFGWAYDNSGSPIPAGATASAVPEPTTLSLLGLGALTA